MIVTGDSSTIGDEDREKFQKFLEDLKAVEWITIINVLHVILIPYSQIKQVEREFTLILDDPMANSYVQNTYAPDPDPNMTTEIYERSWEQNEELGLNDMKVESYSGDSPAEGNGDEAEKS